MAEFTAAAQQTVAPNQVILFTDTPVRGNNSIMHREGSGLVSLRGLTACQPRARFRVSFAIDGEPVITTQMIVTPAAVEEFFNVNRETDIDVPAGCCAQVSVENTSEGDILVQNANLIVERVA